MRNEYTLCEVRVLVDTLAIHRAEMRKLMQWLNPLLKATLRKRHTACVLSTCSFC